MRSPALICLNLQTGVIETAAARAPQVSTVLANAYACLNWARRHYLPVIHVLSRGRFGDTPTPLNGFQAASTEMMVIKTALSVFDDADAAGELSAHQAAIVIGFTGHQDCLATAFDARRRNIPFLFVTDAISSPGLCGFDINTVDAVLSEVLGGLSARTTTAELLTRELLLFSSPSPQRDTTLLEGTRP